MRILHLVNRIDESGDGITNVSIDLAVQQRASGHEVTLGSAGGSYESLLAQTGVDFVRLDFADRRPRAVPGLRRAVKSLTHELRPDVVHVHTLTPALLVASLVGGPPVVATVHNEYQRGVWLMAMADAVVGVSHAVTEAMVSRGMPRRRAWTVLNGTIGSRRRVDIAELPVPDVCRPAVVALGAVSHRKGVDVLLDAFEQVLQTVPEAHLYYVGHEDWTDFVEGARQQPHGAQVHFEGFVAQPQAYLALADVFVLASRREPLGLVLLEAMEAGCAIVGSDADGIPEALGYGCAGLLSPVGDATALARHIEDVLTDRELAARLRAGASTHAETFTVERMSEEYVELYRTLAARRAPAAGRARRRPH